MWQRERKLGSSVSRGELRARSRRAEMRKEGCRELGNEGRMEEGEERRGRKGGKGREGG